MNRIIPILLLATVIMTGCFDEEKFETASGDNIVLSTDTLCFDTLLSGLGSPTRTFTIINPNSDGISITDISFLGGQSKGFRVNVDGAYISGGALNPTIDCRSHDSLRVFVEVTPPEAHADTPEEFFTSLVFTLANGKQKSIVFQAYSQNVIKLENAHFSSSTTLSAQVPYLVFDSVTVDTSATLTLQKGTRFYFYPKAKMKVYGTLVAKGELDEQIQFRGHRTDQMFDGQPYDRIPNQWQGIHFFSSSFGNRLNYVDIHSGYDGIVCDSSSLNQEKLRLENSVVHNMDGDGLRLFSSDVFIGNSQISNAGGNCLTIFGGKTQIVHSTIASFYSFSTKPKGVALVYSDEYHGYSYPLYNLWCANCLITGYAEKEITYAKSEKYSQIAFNHLFQNCLLCMPRMSNSDIYKSCEWDVKGAHKVWREDNFPTFNFDELIYNFSLVEDSPARCIADPALSRQYYLYDRMGYSRLTQGTSDAGCYEYHPRQFDVE